MFVDGRTLPPDAELDADVVIVGAGPAGIAIALELHGRGVRVLMIESGGISPEIPRKHLDIGSSVGHPYYNLMFTRARAFGGTSSRWHMHVHGDEGWMAGPFDAIDFEARTGIAGSGWPFDLDHLAPYYRRAHAMSDLGPETFAVQDWERASLPRLPLDETQVRTSVLQRGMTPFTRFRDAFSTMADVVVVHHATAVEVVTSGEPARTERVIVATSHDRRFSVTGRRFVLACGGIENPRLLLASTGHQPAGLGNGEDLVGRYFMEHLAGRVGYVEPGDPGVVARAGLYNSHREGNVFIQAALTLSPEVLRREGLPNMAFFLLPRPVSFVSEGVRSLKALAVSTYRRPVAAGIPAHVRNVARDAGATLRTVARRVARADATEDVLAVRVQSEQVPNPDSRITLGRGRDRYGIPRVVLDWRVTPFDRQAIRAGEAILAAELRRAGVGPVVRMLGEERPPVVFEGDHHHIGTTRMARDPRHGVVDPDGRLHGVPDLFVTGSSVFPTGGWINPTLTIVALAIRLADHLERDLGVGA